MNDIVDRAARLSVARDAYIARRLPVPAGITLELQRIETQARARLSPAQFESAWQHYEVARMRVQQQAMAASAENTVANANATVDKWTRKMTNGMLGRDGLSQAELKAVREGRTPPQAKRASQQERDEVFRQRTRHLDPAGHGWSEAEYARRMDALSEASPAEFNQLAQGFRANPEQLRATARKWSNESYSYSLQRKREAADHFKGLEPDAPVVTDRDKRRAAIIDAYATHTADAIDDDARSGRQTNPSSYLDDEVSESIINESDNEGHLTRRAVLARNLEAQDSDAGE